MLSKCLLTCLLFKPFRETNLQSGALHKTQNTLKAYAVTLALDDMGKLISMMHSKKNAQHYIRQQTAWHSTKTPTVL